VKYYDDRIWEESDKNLYFLLSRKIARISNGWPVEELEFENSKSLMNENK
jgi:hypothetical protein